MIDVCRACTYELGVDFARDANARGGDKGARALKFQAKRFLRGTICVRVAVRLLPNDAWDVERLRSVTHRRTVCIFPSTGDDTHRVRASQNVPGGKVRRLTFACSHVVFMFASLYTILLYEYMYL